MRFAAIGVAVGAGATAVIVAYPLYYQLFGPLALHGNLIVYNAGSDVASFVRPPWFMQFNTAADRAANASFSTSGVENTGYLGIPVLVVIAALLIWLAVRRSRMSVWWLLTAGAVVALSLGTTVWVNGHRTVLLLPNTPGPGPGSRVMYWQVEAGMRFRIVGGYGVFNHRGRWSYSAHFRSSPRCWTPPARPERSRRSWRC